MKKICAIYTRKSTDERLDMEFNTLDAQREACEAYIMSQKSEGWVASVTEYSDGGYSGGSLERPDLKNLLDDIRTGKVNIVVVYKIDRLTRSLMDFAELVRIFDEHGVTFVSVTQSFNTTTSMGRLTLNVLLSFAQFEREVASERIRDKIAASKAKGMWQGGVPPVGYAIQNRQLVINHEEIKTARHIFDRYLVLGSVRLLKRELKGDDIRSPVRTSLKGHKHGGANFSRGALYAILKNPAYIGRISHKGKIHEGLHDGIIPSDIWERVQRQLKDQAVDRTMQMKRRHMLQGLIYDPEGTLYGPSFTSRHDRQYCYYISQNIKQYRNHPNGLIARIPAQEIEDFVERALRAEIHKMSGEEEGHVLDHILKHHETIPSYDLVRKCLGKVTIGLDEITIHIKPAGFLNLVQKHLNINITGCDAGYEIRLPYKTAKAKRGAVVIEPEGTQKDMFDLPPAELKKLVQGVIWRDEHFAGKNLTVIAQREGYSDSYVGKCILRSFERLQTA